MHGNPGPTTQRWFRWKRSTRRRRTNFTCRGEPDTTAELRIYTHPTAAATSHNTYHNALGPHRPISQTSAQTCDLVAERANTRADTTD
ncbi:hypothetical protein HBH64_026350 [Parastagonospora nodorum]|nr:hypothetical protein HBI02_152330 [Parastagonospora nodorum]KAH4307350.1 hypothetical protein HBI01_052560 [Parastagonospora nodorum]KAH4337006.1 hypothetical protein HBI00_016200 [Parastagonospora nodorum]KAH4382738.1 hypothetical protein HBH94_060740 [Parastagonospora nodorum]KAH4471564.1 hypothetical protein HBH90_053340 [Parastagonospora nodorum]